MSHFYWLEGFLGQGKAGKSNMKRDAGSCGGREGMAVPGLWWGSVGVVHSPQWGVARSLITRESVTLYHMH